MAHDSACFYCTKDQRLHDLMIEVCPLSVSTLYLFRDQTHRGRCIVALNDHQRELFDLTDAKRDSVMADVARAARVISAVVQPGKMNYGAYGDKGGHFHVHLVPKFEGGVNWGSTFEMAPAAKVLLADSEYQELIAALKSRLEK